MTDTEVVGQAILEKKSLEREIKKLREYADITHLIREKEVRLARLTELLA